MKTAILECGATTEVPECCLVGGVTACPQCPAPEGAPGVNCRIVDVYTSYNEYEEDDDDDWDDDFEP